MILKETLRAVVKKQREAIDIIDCGAEREELNNIDLNSAHATVISGIRRCGKSTLLRQLMRRTKKRYYFNFEDPNTMGFELTDFQKLDEVFHEEYGECEHYFFDEIQNIDKWEIFVRALLDKKKKCIITGSNASLLSQELGTRLTGRHIRYELYPFSFNEMLSLTRREKNIEAFEDYLNKGGFPEYIQEQKTEILQHLFGDIIARDIAVRHKIRETKTLKEMAIYLLSNTGKEFSYNQLKKTFELGSTNSAITFVSFFEDSYLLFTLPKFDYSLKKQAVNPKKAYSIDNGLSNANSVLFSSDKGRMLENLAFIHLKRKYKELYYFKENRECDFLIRQKGKITQAIQVCFTLDEDNKKREIEGLTEAMNKFALKKGTIITYNQEDTLEIESKEIRIIPAWKYITQ